MASVQDLKTQIENANALGRTNLAEKGVELSETATTYEIMSKIAEIVSGGGGVEYTNIVYNTDNTITLTDKDGAIHTMSCTYEDGKLIGVTYDGKAVDLTYNGDVLVKVGKTTIDVGNAPATSGATFNIAYGENPPEDTSKLWVKANEPTNVSVGSDFDGVESIASVGYLPTVNTGMGCASIGDTIYLFGGYDDSSAMDTIHKFNTKTQTTTTLSTHLPIKYNAMGCAPVGRKIYLFGGERYGSFYNTIIAFDTETETITTLSTTLPITNSQFCCASVGTKIYLFGGYNGRYLNTIIAFDTETETITTLSTTLPIGCCGVRCVTIGTKVYLFGGNAGGGTVLNTVNVFDISTQEITTLSTTLPRGISDTGCSCIGGKVYIFGGAGSAFFNTIYKFDISTQETTTLSTTLPTTTYGMGCANVGTKIYLFGGSGTSALNTINCFTVTHELTQGNIEIKTSLTENKFNLINTDTAQIEIGVENVYIGNANNEAELCEAYLHNGTEWVVI